jgi:hypothetical protein
VTPKKGRIGWGSLAALLTAWIGLWGAWLPHRVASLRVNAIDLAEWATFLPDVRTGTLRLAPDTLRLALGLAVIGLTVSASSVTSRRWIRWATLGLGLIPGLLMLPPYPSVLQLWWSDSYGLRFTVASVTILGVPASLLADRLPTGVRQSILGVLAAAAVILGFWAFMTLRQPFVILYHSPLPPGWGAVLFAAGVSAAALLNAFAWLYALRERGKSGELSG